MGNHSQTAALLRSIAGQGNTLTVPRVFVKAMGSLEGGLVLNQLIFWSDKGKDGWFYKSYVEWEEEILVSEYQVRKAIKQCEEHGFLETKLRKANGAPTLHYRFSFPKFTEWILEFLGIQDSEKVGNPSPKISETYKQKTTTEDYKQKNTAEAPAARKSKAAAQPPQPAAAPLPADDVGSLVIAEPEPERATGAAIFKAYLDNLGRPLAASLKGREAAAAKRIAEDGWTAEQVAWATDYYAQDRYWQEHHMSLDYIHRQLPVLKAMHGKGQRPPARKLTTKEAVHSAVERALAAVEASKEWQRQILQGGAAA